MVVTILGGGLASISLASFLQNNPEIDTINIIEKEDVLGGLCRSINHNGYIYDIGPHIIFSKDEEVLHIMLNLLGENKNRLRRSNKIIHKDRYINYPFENDLSKLPEKDLKYCIESFLNNPYEEYRATNMLQFFLKTFGEGITNTYLRPYNEKIWKFDSSYMNTEMVERIPKPTNDEIQRSAKGDTVDGYLHQLFFYYPSEGGIEALISSYISRLNPDIVEMSKDTLIDGIEKMNNRFFVHTNRGDFISDILVSTIPPQDLSSIYKSTEPDIQKTVSMLKYNSIIIVFINVKEDLSGDNFTFTLADKEIIFHRISKMDFLGESYNKTGASYIVEITYRDGDIVSSMSDEQIMGEIVSGLKKIKFIKGSGDVNFSNITRHQYAYVIYDLNHSEKMEKIRNYFSGEGLYLHGRFGNFEYWNMDRVIIESNKLAERIIKAGVN